MGKGYLMLLLRKYLSSQVSNEQKSDVEKYYELFDSEPDVVATFSPEEIDNLRNEIKEAVDRSIANKELHLKLVRIFKKRSFQIAAAGIVAFITISAFYLNINLSKKEESGMLSVQAKNNHTILLSDGSKIVLSSGSTLRYPANFNGRKNRTVYLDGKAFFAVARNPSQPFIVSTENIETNVLGTAFCINAFSGDNNLSVTVVSGKVQVSDPSRQLGVLVRNQQLLYDKQKEMFVQIRVNADSISSWMKQDLVIDNLTLVQAVSLLEKQFSVNIIVNEKQSGSKRFNATFPASTNLDHAMKVVCEFHHLRYYYSNQADSVFIEK